jgi:hypothetical protein
VTSTKQNVNGTTDLVAAATRSRQLVSAIVDLTAATAAARRPHLAVAIEHHHAHVIRRTANDHDRIQVDAACLAPERPPGGGRRRPTTFTDHRVSATAEFVAAARRGQIVPASFQAGSPSLVTARAALAPAVEATPVAEYEVIWDGRLSSSRVPADDRQWRWLRGQGVNTIVNLDGAMADLGEHGFESFLWVPLGAGAAPTDGEATRLLKFIQLRDHQPAHISSATRDGRATMVALLRYAIDGWAIERALAEGQRVNGGAALSRRQVAWLLRWAGSHRPGSHRLGMGSTQGSGRLAR